MAARRWVVRRRVQRVSPRSGTPPVMRASERRLPFLRGDGLFPLVRLLGLLTAAATFIWKYYVHNINVVVCERTYSAC